MAQALLITVVGMGLVFAGILLLWLLMAVLVRVTADAPQVEEAPELDKGINPLVELPATDTNLKQRVAAVAVAVALASKPETPLPTANPTNVSAWQLAMRQRGKSR